MGHHHGGRRAYVIGHVRREEMYRSRSAPAPTPAPRPRTPAEPPAPPQPSGWAYPVIVVSLLLLCLIIGPLVRFLTYHWMNGG